MDWIHCNSCFYLADGSEKRRLYFTNCGHLYCSLCLNTDKGSGPDKCSVCKKQYSVVPIDSNMQEELKNYFSDPGNNLKMFLSIINFQNEHRLKLNDHFRYVRSTIKKYKELYEMGMKEKASLEAKLLHLEEDNKNLKRNTTPFFLMSDSRPPMSSNLAQPFNFRPTQNSQNIPLSNSIMSQFIGNSSNHQTTPSHKIWADRITLTSHKK